MQVHTTNPRAMRKRFFALELWQPRWAVQNSESRSANYCVLSVTDTEYTKIRNLHRTAVAMNLTGLSVGVDVSRLQLFRGVELNSLQTDLLEQDSICEVTMQGVAQSKPMSYESADMYVDTGRMWLEVMDDGARFHIGGDVAMPDLIHAWEFQKPPYGAAG